MSEINEKTSSLEKIAEELGTTKDTIRNWVKKTAMSVSTVRTGFIPGYVW